MHYASLRTLTLFQTRSQHKKQRTNHQPLFRNAVAKIAKKSTKISVPRCLPSCQVRTLRVKDLHQKGRDLVMFVCAAQWQQNRTCEIPVPSYNTWQNHLCIFPTLMKSSLGL